MAVHRLGERPLKILNIFLLLLIFGLGCEKELKEHPLPASMKKEIQKKADPNNKAKEITGRISIDEKFLGTLPDNPSLFIIARKSGEDSGPPLAVRRHSFAKFPFDYSIGPANVMLEGNIFEGTIQLKVRLDQDGNAKASPGDLEGTLSVEAGEKKADIVLNHRVEGSKKTITGTIRLDPEMEKNIPENGALFIIARPEGMDRGFPLAVKLVKEVKFPYQFTLGQENVMMPGADFDGAMTLIARLDADGDAKPGPKDVQGHKIANAGDTQVDILLDQVFVPAAGP